jgi:hypothetical protein
MMNFSNLPKNVMFPTTVKFCRNIFDERNCVNKKWFLFYLMSKETNARPRMSSLKMTGISFRKLLVLQPAGHSVVPENSYIILTNPSE